MSDQEEIKTIEAKGVTLRFTRQLKHLGSPSIDIREIIKETIGCGRHAILPVIAAIMSFPFVAVTIAFIASQIESDKSEASLHVRILVAVLAAIWLSYVLFSTQSKALKLNVSTNPFKLAVTEKFWAYVAATMSLAAGFAATVIAIFYGLNVGWTSLMEMHGVDFKATFGVSFLPLCVIATLFSSIFIWLRFSLVLPMLLSGKKPSIKESWAITKNKIRYLIPSIAACLFVPNMIGFAIRNIWQPIPGLNAGYAAYSVVSLMIMAIQLIAVASVPAVFFRLYGDKK